MRRLDQMKNSLSRLIAQQVLKKLEDWVDIGWNLWEY